MPTLTLGDWTAQTLETGHLWLDGGAMFGSVPKPLWSRQHPPDERNRIRLAMRCLLLEGHGRRVLVDDGVGDKFPPKLVDIYRLELGDPTLERSLAEIGLGVDDITDVILTHLHFDHAGGSTVSRGERWCRVCHARATTCSGATGTTPTDPIRANAPRTWGRTTTR